MRKNKKEGRETIDDATLPSRGFKPERQEKELPFQSPIADEKPETVEKVENVSLKLHNIISSKSHQRLLRQSSFAKHEKESASSIFIPRQLHCCSALLLQPSVPSEPSLLKENSLLSAEIKSLKIQLAHLMQKVKEEHSGRKNDKPRILLHQNQLYEERLIILTAELTATRAQLLSQRPDLRLQLASQRDVSYLHAQNQRLFELLRSTKSQKHFGFSVDEQFGLRYLGPEDRQRWVPEKAFKLLHERRIELPSLSEKEVDALLLELNQSFAEREKEIISKAHLFCRSCGTGSARSVVFWAKGRDDTLEELRRRNCFLETKVTEQTRILGRTLRETERKHKLKLRNELLKVNHKRVFNAEMESRGKSLAASGPGRVTVEDVLFRLGLKTSYLDSISKLF